VFSNRGATVPSAVLSLAVPPEATIVEISHGGTEVSPHVVEWQLGDVLAAVGGERTVRVTAPASGAAVMLARAGARTGAVEQGVSEQTTAVTASQPLVFARTVRPNPPVRNEQVAYELTVTNASGGPRTVTVADVIPTEITNIDAVDDGASCGSSCDGGDPISWTFTLQNGETRTRQIVGRTSASISNGELVYSAARVTTAGFEARATRPLRITDDPGLQVALSDDVDPVAPGGDLTYTAAFGNRGTTVAGVTLQLTVPAETTISEISAGGVEVAPHVVEWPLGDVLPAVTGERTVRVTVPAQGSPLLRARAELSAGIGEQSVVEQATAVAASQPLRLSKRVSPNPPVMNEQIVYELMVTNTTGSPAAVVLYDQIPSEVNVEAVDAGAVCPGGSCSAGEPVKWDLGNLQSGETRTRQIVGRTSSFIFDGELVGSTARATVTGFETRATRVLRIKNTPGLQVALADDADPVQPGTDLTYTAVFSNRKPSTVASANLRLRIPPETSIAAISDGGTEISPGVVQWALGDVLAGIGGERTVRVTVPAAASPVLAAVAEASAGLGEQAVADQTTAVSATRPLLVTKTLTPNPVVASEDLIYELTVTNNRTFPVAVRLADVIPSEINVNDIDSGAVCPGGSCSAGEPVEWDLGNMSAGETKTRVISGSAIANAFNGELSTKTARATAANVEARAVRSLRITNQSALQLGMVEDHDPVSPGANLTYTLSFGNRGASSLSNVLLRLKVDPAVSVQSISDGGTEVSPKLVQWSLGTLAAGAVGTRSVIVQTPASGALFARADVRTSSVQATVEQRTAVVAAAPIEVVETVDVNPASRNSLVTYTYVVTNKTDAPSALVLNKVLPQELSIISVDGGLCPGSCGTGEMLTWDLGLVDGQTSVVKQFVGRTYSTANGNPGEVVHDAARATRDGFEARATVDLRVSP
jgi:hypothetical protein